MAPQNFNFQVMGLSKGKIQSLKLHSKLRSKIFNVEYQVPKMEFVQNYIM